jgi:hypothetical protein
VVLNLAEIYLVRRHHRAALLPIRPDWRRSLGRLERRSRRCRNGRDRQNFGLRMRQEIRATELVRGSGPWTQLPYGDKVRKRVLRSFMRLQAKAGTVQTFAVVIDKSRCA